MNEAIKTDPQVEPSKTEKQPKGMRIKTRIRAGGNGKGGRYY